MNLQYCVLSTSLLSAADCNPQQLAMQVRGGCIQLQMVVFAIAKTSQHAMRFVWISIFMSKAEIARGVFFLLAKMMGVLKTRVRIPIFMIR